MKIINTIIGVEFELSKKEMFFMQKGRIVEKISTLANVGISVDEKERKLTVTGAPSAIKKAHELFGDFMDINTVQLDDNTHKQDLNRISQVCNVYFEQSSDDQLTVSYLDKESLEACKEMLKTTEDNQFHSLSLLVDNMPSTVNLAEFSDPHLRQKTHLNYYSLLRSSAVKPKASCSVA